MGIVDSGTSLLAGPKDTVNAIAKKLDIKFNILTHEAIIDCSLISSLPDIDFVIDYKSYPLRAEDYVLQVGTGSDVQCLFAFMGMDFPSQLAGTFILGDVFIRRYYTLFDYEN